MCVSNRDQHDKPDESTDSRMGFIVNDMSNTPRNLPVLNRRKLLIFNVAGLSLALLSITLACINPVAIIARWNTRIAYGSEIYRLLNSEIDGIHIQAYLFNVTNSERFLSGADEKMKVEEIGPFSYKEIRTQKDLDIDSESGLMRYTPIIKTEFIPENSIGDPKKMNVTMPNIALLTMTSMLSSYSIWTQQPFNFLVRRLNARPIVSMDAHNYMWGYDEPLITFGNTMMPGWINFKTMGIMDRLYDSTVTYRLEVGATNSDKFRIKTLNGIKGIKALNYDVPEKRSKCNSFIDTYEGIAYPPGMTKDTKIRIWRNVLCRILELDFHEERQMEYGARALVYKLSNRTYNYNPDKQCLCGKSACYNGISDLSPCFYGLPLAISNAHFLGGEPRLFRKIEGLKPDEKIHGSQFLIEPTIGMALGTSFTVQVNIVVENVGFSRETEKFSDMVVPIAYFRILQPELNEKQIADLKLMSLTGPRLFLAFEIIMFVIGIAMIAYAMRQIIWTVLYGNQTSMDFKIIDVDKEMLRDTEMPLIKSYESS